MKSGHRDTEGSFSDFVVVAFSFLENACHFSPPDVDRDSVLYRRQGYVIGVYRDSQNGEVELVLQSVPNRNGQRAVSLSLVELRNLLSADGPNSAISCPNRSADLQATVSRLGQDLRQFAAPFLDGDEQWLKAAYDEVLMNSRLRRQTSEEEQWYESAREAFQTANYARVIAELGGRESMLSPKSLKLLEMARKQCAEHS